MSYVHGETDSERYFALITRETEIAGDVGEGIVRAVNWLAANVPVFALNLVLTPAPAGATLGALRPPQAPTPATPPAVH